MRVREINDACAHGTREAYAVYGICACEELMRRGVRPRGRAQKRAPIARGSVCRIRYIRVRRLNDACRARGRRYTIYCICASDGLMTRAPGPLGETRWSGGPVRKRIRASLAGKPAQERPQTHTSEATGAGEATRFGQGHRRSQGATDSPPRQQSLGLAGGEVRKGALRQ